MFTGFIRIRIETTGGLLWTRQWMKSSIFWDITPCSPLKVNKHFALLATCFNAGFLADYSSTLKMEAKYSSETSDDFQRTTRRYNSEDRTPHNHRCENLKSYTVMNIRVL
jgi:hypothetical protein